MDWTIVASVLVALLLWPVVMASVGALAFLTAATAFRGRLRAMKDRHAGHCRQICGPGGRPATAAGLASTKSCP